MGALDGRVAIITGAGRGIGREHALLFAAEGAKVVVNDLGGGLHGESETASAAEQVVEEITSFGGEAIANHDDVADWAGGERLVRSAVEHFGDLHVLVNNAGILRDRVLVNLSEEDWDSVVRVHLKGHFVPSRHAAAYWRERAKEGHEVKASIVNTSSTSGLLGNIGQSNYGAAKAGIAAFTVIIADELGRYGVRANAIAPAARTRMTESTPGLADAIAEPEDVSRFDVWNPANVSPLVGVARHGELRGVGQGLLRAGRRHPTVPELDHDRDAREGRPLHDRRARAGAAQAPAVTTEKSVEAHARLDDPDELLDARTDPGASAFGTSGTEAGSDLNWFALLTSRVQRRAVVSGRHRWWVLGALLAGLLALNFTFTVFIVALPRVAHEFSTSITVLTWTMIGPLLAYGLAAPLFGKVGDVFGHRRLYLVGLLGAMVSAVLTAIAPTALALILARTLDGVQGAATGTASMALIMSAFPARERVKAMGWWSLVGAGGPVLGVSLGSPVIQYFGWRSLFWLQLVLLVVAFCVVLVVLPRRAEDRLDPEPGSTSRAFRSMDWVGSWSLSLSVTTLMLGLSLGHEIGWLSPGAWVCWVATVVGMCVFVVRIRTSPNPLIPPAYFGRRNFSLPMVLRCTGNFAYFGAFFLAPLLMELGYGFSYTKVGLVSIARPLAFAIFSPIAGYVAVKVGERTTAIVGTAALTGSLALFAALQPSTSIWWLLTALALSGFGMGVAMPATSAIMANEVAERDFGVMSAAQILAMQVGEVAGIQVLTTIQQGLQHSRGFTKGSTHAELLSTFHLPFVVGTAVASVSLVAALLLRRVPRHAPVGGGVTGVSVPAA